MQQRIGTVIILVLFAIGCSGPPRTRPEANRYVDPQACAACHSRISETYKRTGMARSFYRPADAAAGEPFYHKPSGTWFHTIQRADGLYQRRWQIGYQGKDDNVEELKVDYVMGSGNHVRTFLHRTSRGTLIELPLAWYAEKAGHWGMSPGYDSDHWPSRRVVGYDCMFCHNAYPAIPAGHEGAGSEPAFAGALPEGIDCQRCHGPGQLHILAAGRGAIVNPARLSPDRRMEVCMQCHLETTSFPLPNAIRRFDRAPFSFRPGEALAAFEMFFDHAPGTGSDDKFEIVSSVYRLRKSRCFLQSNGSLTCTTCHNPHDIPHGPEARTHYNGVCRGCHTSAFESLVSGGKHTSAGNCIECHMPKRRTEDVVHAVMTDHLIQRPIAGRLLLAALAERKADYRGEVADYYGGDPLYHAVAQLVARSNVEAGIPLLEAELDKNHPPLPEPYIELGDAWRDRGNPEKAAKAYNEALRRRPGSPLISRRLAGVTRDRELLKRVAEANPSEAGAWYDLGLLESDQGRKAEATAALSRAAALDPDMTDAQNSLGAVFAESGSLDQAEQAFRAALRINPFHGDAHANLAKLLASRGDLPQAAWQFEKAVRLNPEKAPYEFDYGVVLARLTRYAEAEQHIQNAVRIDPNFAEAHDLLGGLMERRGQAPAALLEYQEAVRIRPTFGKAHLNLGTLLANKRDLKGAAEHFRIALTDPDDEIRREARQSLSAIGAQ